jgi:hypothetical protein
MATVRLTESFNKEILHQAGSIYDARLTASNILPPEFNTKDIYELWLDQEPGLRSDIEVGIRRNWLTSMRVLKLSSLNNKALAPELSLHESPTGVWVSQAMSNGYNGGGIKLHGHRATELWVIYQRWNKDRRQIHDSRDQFQEQIKNLLSRHQTLKQVLSEWPALWDFVPQEFKNKHNEEKERVARAKAEPDHKPKVDLDVLNGAVVTAKILKSGWT